MQLLQDATSFFAARPKWMESDESDAMIQALAAGRRCLDAPPASASSGARSAGKLSSEREAGSRNERGMERRRSGDLQGALQEFDAALRLNPTLAVAYNNRGVTRHELGDLDGALADLDEALRLNPKYADACGNRAAVRTDRDDAAGAAADCQRALELAPDSASLHARRGALLHHDKNWLAARAEYNRALQLDAGLYWVYLLRGNTHYHTGDWQLLLADYSKGFALAAPRCAALVVRHLQSALKADAAAALRMAQEHVQQNPSDAIARAHRGLLLLLLGRSLEAEVDLRHCRALYAEAGFYLDPILRLIREQPRRDSRSSQPGPLSRARS